MAVAAGPGEPEPVIARPPRTNGAAGPPVQPKNHWELAPRRETRDMAKSTPEKKTPPEIRVLPMELKLGDRLADERSEWQVIGRPYTTGGGKTAHVRVESVNQPGVTEIRSWGSHERVGVKRAEGKG